MYERLSAGVKLARAHAAGVGLSPAIVVSALLFVVGPGSAQVTFTKVADQNTAIPDGTGTFTAFTHPAISGGRVMFAANGAGQQGIYAYENQSLGVVGPHSADFTLPVTTGSSERGVIH